MEHGKGHGPHGHHPHPPFKCPHCDQEIKFDKPPEKPAEGERPKLICPNCNKEIKPFCPHCKAELEPPQPGEKLEGPPKCKACGKELPFFHHHGPHGGHGHGHGPHGCEHGKCH